MVLAGCTQSASNTADAGLTTCDPSQRSGTYLLEFQQQSGNCGELADQMVTVQTGTNAGWFLGRTTCNVVMNTWSHGMCRDDIDLDCPSEDSTRVGYGDQETADGSANTVQFSVTSTAVPCESVYTWQ